MYYSTVQSPIGLVTLAADDQALRELHLEGDRYFAGVPATWVYRPEHKILAQAAVELAEYFKGNAAFSVPVDFGGTDFRRKVWEELRLIPAGRTVSYAELAEKIGSPKAVRAVGTAVGRNPLCVVVPCHRVVTSSGGLGGYVAGLERKQFLLKLEGAV